MTQPKVSTFGDLVDQDGELLEFRELAQNAEVLGSDRWSPELPAASSDVPLWPGRAHFRDEPVKAGRASTQRWKHKGYTCHTRRLNREAAKDAKVVVWNSLVGFGAHCNRRVTAFFSQLRQGPKSPNGPDENRLRVERSSMDPIT